MNLHAILDAHVQSPVELDIPVAVLQSTLDYLASPEALTSISRDPYWPKWDSTWWHMTLLHELGLAALIPESVALAMSEALRTHYLPVFPIVESELPPGVDPHRQILCHCALGTMLQVLAARGIPIDVALPGARAWMLDYQLPDGGLNCDEGAYTRAIPRSSMVSTLPPLEALLYHPPDRPFTTEEIAFLDAGADYLLQRRLCRSLSKGSVIDETWLTPRFPRFYEYDVLRGLRFVAAWARRLSRPLPWEAVEEVVERLASYFAEPAFAPRPWAHLERTIPAVGPKSSTPAGVPELLEVACRPEVGGVVLRREWHAALEDLLALQKA